MRVEVTGKTFKTKTKDLKLNFFRAKTNLENQRDYVTVDQAKRIAKLLKEPVELWVEVALQDMLDRAGINATVKLVA